MRLTNICKALAATGEGVALLRASYAAVEPGVREEMPPPEGASVLASTAANPRKVADAFITAIAQHRDWSREMKGDVPA